MLRVCSLAVVMCLLQLGRWVEKGKEEEARAELAALAAPPPAPAAVAPAADVAAPNGDGQSPVPPAGPKYNRQVDGAQCAAAGIPVNRAAYFFQGTLEAVFACTGISDLTVVTA